MKSIPFELPESLKSYLVTYQDDPDKGMQLLEKHVNKRRNDAVGFLLLALMHHHAGNHEKAIKSATMSGSLAPGSPLLENLQYFLSHPDGFDAWIPNETLRRSKSLGRDSGSNGMDLGLDLDTLISRLSRANQKRIKISDHSSEGSFNPDAVELELLATPTLAMIYERQNNYDEAIRMYRRLIECRPDRADDFKHAIDRIEKNR